jgi:hypothetical protein
MGNRRARCRTATCSPRSAARAKVSASSVLLDGGAILDSSTGIFSDTSDVGPGGSITIVAGELVLHNGANVLADSFGDGAGGPLAVLVGGALTVDSGASLGTLALGTGNAGNVSVTAAGQIAIDMTVGAVPSILDGIGSVAVGSSNTGDVSLLAKSLTIRNSGELATTTFGLGRSGNVSVNACQKRCRSTVPARLRASQRVSPRCPSVPAVAVG